MSIFRKLQENIHLIAACVLITSCNTSDSAPDTDQPSSTGSSLVIPIPEEFYSDTTVMVEILVFNKADVNKSVMVDQLQIDRDTINENTELLLLQIDREATLPIGIVASDGFTELGEFRQCEGDLEVQNFNYILRSTDSSGETVSIVNTDFCGSVPSFDFDDIDGQVDVLLIISLIS